ncbi:NADP-dependent 3-hydroxy acid dehydrogenase YdfG [Paenibacillus sophorae]|uniref:NADP-dependent 3-hydroxy acid dehydrogenase YdfG n=1 Tax=Paenibacillus sophorae TaxID=1333845 RepID=A0A1H8UN60_9BACL|nr:SDR family oxidoreductase [Paenibacillus sophorae]QWU13322.1 SDR family oxidoreductase [Paenibacillus sophorae]SEP04649.1 NADP-dependent 3-hydroxy acid dehydrogenase YdfG [Paenibacillus sophorae]
MTQSENRGEEAVALVTGTSSGFGLLTAVKLAEKGFTVIAAMRDPSRKEDLERLAERSGVLDRLHVMRMDVTDSAGIEEAITEALTAYGRIDVLVNNAGYAAGGFVEEVPMEEWRRQLETNFFGLVAVTKAVLPAMRERRTGLIINIGSVSGLAAFPGFAPYAASKFAVEGFSESLRHEMSPFGVKVVLLEPGAYRTAIWNKGLSQISTSDGSPYQARLDAVLRYARKSADTAPDPQEVADLIGRIVQMRSPRLRYVLGRGSRLMIGGRNLLPWSWFERIVARALR